MLASHNEGEGFIWVWTVDKQKPDSMRYEKLVFFEKEDVAIMEMNGRDVWLVRPGDSERKLYNFNVGMI